MESCSCLMMKSSCYLSLNPIHMYFVCTEKIQVSLVSSAPKRANTGNIFAAASTRRNVIFNEDSGCFEEVEVSESAPPATSSNQFTSSGTSHGASSGSGSSSGAPMSAMEKLMREEEQRKSVQLQNQDKQERKDYWLHVGIVVKILNKRVGDGQYYKEKGTVERVIDRYVGEVRLSDRVKLRLDQEDLETVLPKVEYFCRVIFLILLFMT